MLRNDPSWHALAEHYQQLLPFSLAEQFNDPESGQQRAIDLTLSAAGLTFDFSKNWLTPNTLMHWAAYAHACEIGPWREALFGGSNAKNINHTEQRAALHTALRGSYPAPLSLPNIETAFEQQQAATADRVSAIIEQRWLNKNGQPFTDVVHLGTGGSHLGPELLCQALPKASNGLTVHFLPNIDQHSFLQLNSQLDWSRTLVVMASKSFGTQEVMLNLAAIANHSAMDKNDWLTDQALAITANPKKAIALGIPAEHCLTMDDSIGGRYSVWSAIGATVALHAGQEAFLALRQGAQQMDSHFYHTELQHNAPFIAAALACGYRQFASTTSQAIFPYMDRLRLLPAYLQQLIMESNGKRVDRNGNVVNYPTGQVIWGNVGTNAQHAVMQLLHQGTDVVPVDFIGLRPESGDNLALEQARIANMLGQARALMLGQPAGEPHRIMPGNRPSTTILLDDITPTSLGALLAFYEHKVFCQSVLWNINPFDQWGVELGKQMGSELLQALQDKTPSQAHDSKAFRQFDGSTQNLLAQLNASSID